MWSLGVKIMKGNRVSRRLAATIQLNEALWEMQGKIGWGRTCHEYRLDVTAEKIPMGGRAILLWQKLPRYLVNLGKRISNYITANAQAWGFSLDEVRNPPNRAELLSVFDKDTVMIKLSAPEWNVSSSKLFIASELEASQDNLGDRMLHIINNINAAKCTVAQDTVVTFNNKRYRSEMPHICNQVLAQDCTSEHKFLVLLKRDLILNQNDINVLVADLDVGIYQRRNVVGVTVNGVEIPVSSLPYEHPTGTVRITRKDQGISLFAASHGLNEVFLDLNGLQIKIPDWMRGYTCGMCGLGDGEYMEEYRTPNGRVATNALSFTQSWVIPGTGCRDISKCYLATESVKLDRQISLNGQDSKCYSVEPVLRCQPGCAPVRTTSVNVGFHCVPAESSVNRAESLSRIFQKSVDVTEKAVAHLACRCNPQCA